MKAHYKQIWSGTELYIITLAKRLKIFNAFFEHCCVFKVLKLDQDQNPTLDSILHLLIIIIPPIFPVHGIVLHTKKFNAKLYFNSNFQLKKP